MDKQKYLKEYFNDLKKKLILIIKNSKTYKCQRSSFKCQ